MEIKIVKNKLKSKILLLSFIVVNAANAMNIGGSLTFDNSKTAFSECQHIADAINSKQELYCSPDAINKEYLWKAIEEQKEKLKKCEKKWRRHYWPKITGGNVSISFTF